MIISNINIPSMSAVKAKVDIYNGDILATTCTCGDVLEDFTISREGDTGKFFGFGVCQKLSVNFIDLFRNLTADKLDTGFNIKVQFGDGEVFDNPYPNFYIDELNRDEKTNTITCTAYDKLYNSSQRVYGDLGISIPYSIEQLAEACAELLGVTLKIDVNDNSFETLYETGGNFEPTDNIRYVLNTIAEATQTIYFLNNNDELVFKRLNQEGDSVLTITKNDYYELTTKTVKTLAGICSATELGDNVENKLDIDGITQYVRDNPLWELREDIADLVDNALAAIGGIAITQFECDWSGNYLLEIGDKISLIAEDNSELSTYLICDSIEYAGALGEISRWEYTEQGAETANNPTSLGDALNQTFARVDKVNKQIELVVSDAEANKEQLATLQINTDSINATVSSNNTSINELSDRVDTLSSQVSASVTADQLSVEIKKELEQGAAAKVITTTGFTFDETGLSVEKSTSEMRTKITEDGMTVYKFDDAVLQANNEGVKAVNLHATTYLIVGMNSRFEDYKGGERTGCFWING